MSNRFIFNILLTAVCLVVFGRLSAARAVSEALFVGRYDADTVSLVDSVSVGRSDTVRKDTVNTDSINMVQNQDKLNYRVEMSAEDSMVFMGNGDAFLYKSGKIIYNEPSVKELTADYISISMDSSKFHAEGVRDSANILHGHPVLKDGGQTYESETLDYNYKTGKGFIRGAKTREGESYIIADETKKTADGFMNMRSGKYTTCDNLSHPHFYLHITKGRVKPGGYITAGPAYMVVEDLPLPLAIPFGFFPFTSKYASGILMPSYGDEMQAGFFLKNGGYYFAINDYVDLALTGDIYTKGSWALHAESSYRKRYAFSGNVNIHYNNTIRGEKDLPGYSENKDFRIDWTHQQDPKASSFSTFSALVNFFTSGYNRNSIDYNYSPEIQSQAETSSSINFTQKVPGTPINLSVNASARQNIRDSSLNLTLPNIRMDVSTIYPLKNKKRVGSERFYEKFSFSYSMEFANSFSGKESRFMRSNLSKDWQNGILHSPRVDLPISLFKYITVRPNVTYTERWYFNRIEQNWDTPRQKVKYDTISGFYRVYDFSTGLSLSTTLYGFYSPIKPLRNALGIGDIRHVFKPSISFTYTPDFSDPQWNMYKTYTQEIVDASTGVVSFNDIKYSPYSSGKYGVPSAGRNQRISIYLDNNIEMKVRDRAASDTVDNANIYKKISLIDNLQLRGGYNFAADSLGMEDISASVRLKITKSYSVTLSTTFEVYEYALKDNGTPVKINRYRWNNGKLPWFTGTSINFSYTLNNNTFAKKQDKDKNKNQGDNNNNKPDDNDNNFNIDPSKNHSDNKQNDKKDVEEDSEGYQKPDFQWSVSFNAGIGWHKTSEFDPSRMEYRRDFSDGIVGLSGYINPTSNWQIGYSATVALLKNIRINSMSLNIQRNLHCWHISASVTPLGQYKSFMVTIGANASILRDFKYDKRQRDNIEIK